MKLLNPTLLRWLVSLSLLGICNAYGQNAIYSTGSGGGGNMSPMAPSFMFTPLPVELLYFKAVPQDDYVVLTWATASESNCSHFIVERSSEGRHFEEVQQIDGGGNSVILLNYQTVDEMPLPGRSYYRLKQVDFDGSSKYSPIVSIYFTGNQNMSLYPTIASTSIHVALSAEFLPETVNIRVIDAAGRIISTEHISIGEDISRKELNLPVSSLDRGLYMLQAEGAGGFYLQERFVVQ
jgi:hypothetical protein